MMGGAAHILNEYLSPKGGTPSPSRFEKYLSGLGLLLVVLICAGGWGYYQYQSTQAREAARKSLSAIADLKAEEISN